MAFKVRKSESRRWPVTVKLLESDAAGVVVENEQTFVALWRPVTEAERVEIAKALEEKFGGADAAKLTAADMLARNADYFGRLLVGWGDEVVDESGQPIPFSVERLTEMITGLDGLAISAALNQADLEIRLGFGARKNASTSPAPGEASGAGEAETNSPTT